MDFDATINKAHLVEAYQSGPVVSLSENKNRRDALKRECMGKSILGLEDLHNIVVVDGMILKRALVLFPILDFTQQIPLYGHHPKYYKLLRPGNNLMIVYPYCHWKDQHLGVAYNKRNPQICQELCESTQLDME